MDESELNCDPKLLRAKARFQLHRRWRSVGLMIKGKTTLHVDKTSGSKGSPRAKVDDAVLKDRFKSLVTTNATGFQETQAATMTPRSAGLLDTRPRPATFPVMRALIIDSPSQTLLSAEGLQALGSSITAIASCSTYTAALSTAEQQLRILMMNSVLLAASRATPHVISCAVRENVVECATATRVYPACDRVEAFVAVGGEAVALQCCSAARYPTHQVRDFGIKTLSNSSAKLSQLCTVALAVFHLYSCNNCVPGLQRGSHSEELRQHACI